MQFRMRDHQLTDGEVSALLARASVGRLATHNSDGFPYVVPVHFVYLDGKIFVHGLNRGQKLANIQRNSNVCFEVDEMTGLLLAESPCDVNTEYSSVVMLGMARIVEDAAQKISVLGQIVAKYTPSLAGRDLSPEMVSATAIIEVTIKECTGKYYR